MAKRNSKLFLKVVDDHCAVCGETNGVLASAKARFRAGRSYTSGKVCDKCKPSFDRNVDILAAGGILIKCACGAVTAALEVPGYEEQVTQMPNGIRRLEVQQCALCTKEGDHVVPTHSIDQEAELSSTSGGGDQELLPQG